MAINIIDIKYNKAVRNTIHEFICDTDTDFALLPKCDPGSMAVSVATGTVYVVNASGNWVEFGVSDPEPEPEPDVIALSAGLYQAGAIALYEEQGAEAVDGMMIKSWDDLLAEGVVHVENGSVYTNLDMDTWVNNSADILVGDLVLPNDGSITTLSESAFDSCINLTVVDIPNSVTNIDSYAFCNCSSLTSITMTDSVTRIGESTFYDCSSLKNLGISDSITSISDYLCTSTALTNITIPDGVTSIGMHAFDSCFSLESAIIPDSVTYIGYSAFAEDYNLKSITFTGTSAQWATITKEAGWYLGISAAYVKCSDGQVALQ